MPVLTESIETINRQLREQFGIDTASKSPMFRVVWSEDQYEKRLMDVTDEGLILLTPQVREVKKYSQWIKERYVLESLVLVPEQNQAELAGLKVSYEPLWVFSDNKGDYLPPAFWACKFVIDTRNAAMGKTSLKKYVDEEALHPEETKEKRIAEYMEQLFGDESSLAYRTVTGEATIVPRNYPEPDTGE